MSNATRRLPALLAGAAVGAAAAYLLDPDRGRARRAGLRDRAAGSAHRMGRHLGRGLRHVESDAEGAVMRAVHLSPGPAADDLALVDRVSSMVLLGRPELRGRFNLDASDGVVTIRGEAAAAEAEDVVEAIREIPGVREVIDLLHGAGTPAPNKAAAIHAG